MYFWLTAIIAFTLDRFTKSLVTSKMALGETYPVIQNFFHITYIRNAGAAFGILAEMRWFFIVVSIIILGIIIYMVYTIARSKPLLMITLGLTAGGAVGNLIDRVQGGLVIDFIDFRGIWPYIFNAADMFIVISVGLLAIQLFFEEKL